MCFSFRNLSMDLSQTKLRTVGTLYLVQIVISFASGALFFAIFLTGGFSSLFPSTQQLQPISPFYGGASFILLGGWWFFLGIISIGSEVIQLLGSYYGYDSVGKALRNPKPPTPPQPSAPPPPGSLCLSFPGSTQTPGGQTCPRCGNVINESSAKFCSNCGNKL